MSTTSSTTDSPLAAGARFDSVPALREQLRSVDYLSDEGIAGIVFLAWLNGHQNHFTMPSGMQSARGVLHYADIFRLADKADVLDRPDLATRRMKGFLSTFGIGE